jgi:hypothetical protein
MPQHEIKIVHNRYRIMQGYASGTSTVCVICENYRSHARLKNKQMFEK